MTARTDTAALDAEVLRAVKATNRALGQTIPTNPFVIACLRANLNAGAYRMAYVGDDDD